jgi:hypothetical protein
MQVCGDQSASDTGTDDDSKSLAERGARLDAAEAARKQGSSEEQGAADQAGATLNPPLPPLCILVVCVVSYTNGKVCNRTTAVSHHTQPPSRKVSTCTRTCLWVRRA